MKAKASSASRAPKSASKSNRKTRTAPGRAKPILNATDLEAAPLPASSGVRRGSIKQHLDMYEDGPLRGDEILHHHGLPQETADRPALDVRIREENYNVDLSEEGREGDEESGDEHSSGMQASDQQEMQYDVQSPSDANSGSPGEMTEILAHLDPSRKGYRRRAG